VPAGAVEALLNKCDRRGAVPLTAIGCFAKGLKVRVRSGIFAGQPAEIAEMFSEGRDRVRVLFTLLGSQAKLELHSYEIEAA